MTTPAKPDVAIIGAGNSSISVAYHLVTRHGAKRVVLLDLGDPMGLTSAQSGENHRNWWPHPVWFMSPIPPKGINVNFPMTEPLKQAIASPNDKGV